MHGFHHRSSKIHNTYLSASPLSTSVHLCNRGSVLSKFIAYLPTYLSASLVSPMIKRASKQSSHIHTYFVWIDWEACHFRSVRPFPFLPLSASSTNNIQHTSNIHLHLFLHFSLSHANEPLRNKTKYVDIFKIQNTSCFCYEEIKFIYNNNIYI